MVSAANSVTAVSFGEAIFSSPAGLSTLIAAHGPFDAATLTYEVLPVVNHLCAGPNHAPQADVERVLPPALVTNLPQRLTEGDVSTANADIQFVANRLRGLDDIGFRTFSYAGRSNLIRNSARRFGDVVGASESFIRPLEDREVLLIHSGCQTVAEVIRTDVDSELVRGGCKLYDIACNRPDLYGEADLPALMERAKEFPDAHLALEELIFLRPHIVKPWHIPYIVDMEKGLRWKYSVFSHHNIWDLLVETNPAAFETWHIPHLVADAVYRSRLYLEEAPRSVCALYKLMKRREDFRNDPHIGDIIGALNTLSYLRHIIDYLAENVPMAFSYSDIPWLFISDWLRRDRRDSSTIDILARNRLEPLLDFVSRFVPGRYGRIRRDARYAKYVREATEAQAAAAAKAAHKILTEPAFKALGERIMDAMKRSKRPVVVFDIDDTLLSTSERIHEILSDFLRGLAAEHPSKSWAPDLLKRISPAKVGFGPDDALRDIGLEDMGLEVAFRQYFRQHFLSERYLTKDGVKSGAAEFLAELKGLGVRIVYLSGRLQDEMRAGTVASFKAYGFPDEDLDRNLIMRADSAEPDEAFKGRVLNDIAGDGEELIAVFDNEPANLIAISSLRPDLMLFWMTRRHRADAPRPPAHAMRINDFLGWID